MLHEVLAPEVPLDMEDRTTSTTGILPSQQIRELLRDQHVLTRVHDQISEAQIQPASLDLRLGTVGYRVQASFLPGQFSTVEERIKDLQMVRVDLTRTTVLEKGCVYIVPLLEELNLPEGVSAKANPKSTTGRLDIFTRLITDHGTEFENVPAGYKGKLYAEIVPRTFTVMVRAGMRLNQLRFIKGRPNFLDSAITALDEKQNLVYLDEDNPVKAMVDSGLKISVNLEAQEPSEVIAYKAKRNAPVIDLDKIDCYDPQEFWDAKYQVSSKGLILDPGDFYILASKERIRVPSDCAAEMVPIDPSVGEFRIHYAGFFDPGFGYGANDIKGTRAVLEVRAHEVPFLVEHSQIVGRLIYMGLLAAPDKVYGLNIGSSYQRQSLTLSKQFKRKQ
ncbi:MAG TPA: 2'-deoxycytidine 5'-triphosphate deaminase [Terriglobales bacterium]|nr:2'-deoxycytidine 5'-triphosphate deaminase [Terriglobales bacterium]